MRVFGIDPGSERTGYGCVETDGRRHRLIVCGAIGTAGHGDFAARLATIHRTLVDRLRDSRPDAVAIESLFHAVNVRSALKLGHARGVAMLAAVDAGVEVVEYSPSEIKRAVVGYGRAEKAQVQQMVKLLLGLDHAPSPHDAADALAVALCHVHRAPGQAAVARAPRPRALTSWRAYRPAAGSPTSTSKSRRGGTRP
ncbi:MAG: crossover junction endodeoxyribonuclease RuvC [Vicinamibacterales bacterium]